MRTTVRAVILTALVATIAVFAPLHYAKDGDGALVEDEPSLMEVDQHAQLNTQIRRYLAEKDSPLADYVPELVALDHWKLIVAISAIESQYCKRQLYHNCWGIKGGEDYRHYSSFIEAARDADALITRWQKRGRWLTVEDMNCHYVVPCNAGWVDIVHHVLNELNAIERNTTSRAAPKDDQ